MKNFYEQNLTVTPSLCDPNERLGFDAILTIFQDVTTTHSNQMGLGHSDMIANSNAFWVLSKTKFKLTGEIKVYNELNAKTYPLKPSAIRFIRENVIKSKNGYVEGVSEWCILDATSMAIRKINTVAYPTFSHLEGKTGLTFSRLNESVLDTDYAYTYQTTLTDIDANNHVNNVSYCRMALNAFTPKEWTEFNFNGFEINYISQTFYGYNIKIYKKVVENGVYIEGKYNDKTVFKTLFTK